MSNEQGCQCGQAHGACTTEFQYAVKLVCGQVKASTEGQSFPPVAPGQYWTAINIHNPDKCKNAQLRVKVAFASQDLSGPVSQYYEPIVLTPDAAFEIDCPTIMAIVKALFPPPNSPPTFAKGYFVIESDIELDVVAVYTGAPTAAGPLTTFHTERVQPRCVPVCEDLVLPLHTGIADWQTVSPTVGQLGPVVPLVAPLPSTWAVPPFGSSWVSQTRNDTTLITRHYELCFDLCSGFVVPAPIQIQVLADDSAQVSLNGPLWNNVGQVGAVTGGTGYQTPTPFSVNPSLLKVGRNCFRVDVTNGPPPHGGRTGFALAGILRIARGKCPCSPLPIAAAPTSQVRSPLANFFAPK
jgi:hypothetical protein